jgi:methylenetetrahydrofolate dehydrogenase (NADP+)/methenyltetrahydrofolate cyclohydrolase
MKVSGSVSILHKDTPEQMKYELLQEADVIVSATGQIHVVDTHVHSLKCGVVLIDVGFTRVVTASSMISDLNPNNNNNNNNNNSNSSIVDIVAGDIHPRCYSRSLAYTPVPGGVGPVTVACLLRNILKAATTLHT